jgi:hypothetical protein
MHQKRLAMYIIGRMEKATGFNTHPPLLCLIGWGGETPPFSLEKRASRRPMRRRRDDERGGGDQGDERVCGWYNKDSVWSKGAGWMCFLFNPPTPPLSHNERLYMPLRSLSRWMFSVAKNTAGPWLAAIRNVGGKKRRHNFRKKEGGGERAEGSAVDFALKDIGAGATSLFCQEP